MSDIENLAEEAAEEAIEHKSWKGVLWGITKVVLIIVVTGGLLYYVFSKVPFAKIENRLAHANRIWLAAAIACYFASMLFSAWRLLSFFKSIGLNLNYRFNLRLYFSGLCYNLLLPGGIGGDGYKIYLLHKVYKQPTKKVFFSILFDRLSGFWAIGFFATGLITLIPRIQINIVLLFTIFMGGSCIYYFVIRRFFKDYTHNFFAAHLKAIGVQATQLLLIICLLQAQPDFISGFAPYLLSFLISALAAVIPASLGGGGIRDSIMLNLSKPFHLVDNMAVYLTFTFYLISIFVALFGTYYVFFPKHLEKGLKPSTEK
jgi:uncharacterized membrane protein YbhN (UPF0104 family)